MGRCHDPDPYAGWLYRPEITLLNRQTETLQSLHASLHFRLMHPAYYMAGCCYSRNEMIGKGAYLRQLTASTAQMKSVTVGKELEGSTPPSVFIGSWNYPDVFAGPMVVQEHGDTRIMDMPESWISGNKTQEEIIGYGLISSVGNTVSMLPISITGFVEKLQEISLSGSSIESEVSFTSTPQGQSFSEEHTPFGPSAPIENFSIETGAVGSRSGKSVL